jgi:hypothetical protein
VNEPAAGKLAGRIDLRPRETELPERAQDCLQLVVQRGRRTRADADETIEMVVERRLEIVGVFARLAPLLDPRSQARSAAASWLGSDGTA